jgi:hypothetical protein
VKQEVKHKNPPEDRVAVRTPNVPGYSMSVDRKKYEAMRSALLAVLPVGEPALSQNEMMKAVLPYLDQALFPGGAKSGWWLKCVQLDLEARGTLERDPSAEPLRWIRATQTRSKGDGAPSGRLRLAASKGATEEQRPYPPIEETRLRRGDGPVPRRVRSCRICRMLLA